MPSLDLDTLFEQALLGKRLKSYRRLALVEARQELDGYYAIKDSLERIPAHDFEFNYQLMSERKGDWSRYRPNDIVWGFQYTGEALSDLNLNPGDYIYSRHYNGTSPVKVAPLHDFQLAYRQRL